MAGNNLRRYNARRSYSSAQHRGGMVNGSEVWALVADLENLAETAEDEARVAVAKSTTDALAVMKGLAAVDTGFMRASTTATYADDGLSAQIGPTASYAPFVEYGTSDTPPQPFVGPAGDAVEPGFMEAMAQIAGRNP